MLFAVFGSIGKSIASEETLQPCCTVRKCFQITCAEIA